MCAHRFDQLGPGGVLQCVACFVPESVALRLRAPVAEFSHMVEMGRR